MITFLVFKLLLWLYDWGSVTNEIKGVITALSALEFAVFIVAASGFCVTHIPRILQERKRKKEQSK